MHPTHGGRDRVVELETHDDVTVEFANDEGGVDLLAQFGFTLASAKKRCRMSSDDMLTESAADGAIAALATVDQERLWAAAQDVRESDVGSRPRLRPPAVTPRTRR